MIKYLVAAGAIALSQLIGISDIPVEMELEPVYEAIPDPPALDFGQIKLDDIQVDSFIHCQMGNVNTSLWAYVIDEEGGWDLAPEPGIDQYAIKVNGISMSAEPQQIYPLIEAYGNGMIPMKFLMPAQDTQGAGVKQKYVFRIEARPATMEPGVPGID